MKAKSLHGKKYNHQNQSDMRSEIKELPLVQKAYVINENHMEAEFGYHACNDVVYAETTGKAKSKLLNSHAFEEWKTSEGDELTYLNIPIRRAKGSDKYLFRGKEQTKSSIEYILDKEDRDNALDKLLEENPNAKAYVYSGIRGGYWGENHCGYYSDKHKAGIYSLEEAVGIVQRSCLSRNEQVEMIDPDQHNKEVMSRIEKLKTHLV